jgi:cytochrome o ubiquinol oxidase subunit II
MFPWSPSRLRPIRLVAPAVALALGGCSTVVMNPAGDVARQESHLILWATGLMLLIIIPVMALTVLFAWRYRASNDDAEYRPDWDHSTGLELIIWAAPLMIIIALGALTWVGTHTLDPYRSLSRIGFNRPTDAARVRPLEIQVVALDWKWLFIYPEQGVATINELVLPVDRPVRFRMTSATQMNTLWVPTMAGMIYSMAGMETVLHGVINKPGKYAGRSANYSGAGFSGMRFWAYALPERQFDTWATRLRGQTRRLDAATYLRLERPTENVRPFGFGAVEGGLFNRVVQMCVQPGTRCMDMMGQGGRPAVNNRPPQAGERGGALTLEPEQKGSSPHLSAPQGAAPGKKDRRGTANRNLTFLAPRGLPPRAAADA